MINPINNPNNNPIIMSKVSIFLSGDSIIATCCVCSGIVVLCIFLTIFSLAEKK